MTHRPTPVTPDRRAAPTRWPSASGPRVAVPTALLGRLGRERRRGARRRRRRGPRRDATGGRSPSAGPPRAPVPRPPGAVVRPHLDRPGGRRAGRLPRGPASRSPPAAGRSGVCGGSVPVFGGVVARPHAPWTGSSTSTTTSLMADVRAGTFGPDLEAALGAVGAATPSGTGPSRWTCRPSAGGWPAGGPASTRPATARSRTWCVGLEVVLADGRVVRTEGTGPRAATGPDLTQLFVGSRRHPRGHHRRPRSRIHPLPAGRGPAGLRLRHLRRRASTPAGASCAGAPPRRCSASTTRPSPRRNFDRRRHERPHRPRRGRPGLLARPPWRSWTTSAPAAARELDVGLVERWLAHRNDVSALAPLWRGGHRRRHHRDRGAVGRPARPLRRGRRRPRAMRGTLAASVHQSPRLPRRRLPLLHLRRAARPDEATRRPSWPGRRATTGAAWDAVTEAARSPHGAAISHHHGIGLNRARFLPDGPRQRLRRPRSD